MNRMNEQTGRRGTLHRIVINNVFWTKEYD